MRRPSNSPRTLLGHSTPITPDDVSCTHSAPMPSCPLSARPQQNTTPWGTNTHTHTRERERERETDRQTDRQRGRGEGEREGNNESDGERERERERTEDEGTRHVAVRVQRCVIARNKQSTGAIRRKLDAFMEHEAGSGCSSYYKLGPACARLLQSKVSHLFGDCGRVHPSTGHHLRQELRFRGVFHLTFAASTPNATPAVAHGEK